jgi:hypothetical protein
MTKILMPVDESEHDKETTKFLGKLFKNVQDIGVMVLHVAHFQYSLPSAIQMEPAPLSSTIVDGR